MKINKPKNIDSMSDFEKKHTPKIDIIADKVIVSVGCGIEHPMNKEHFISQIEVFLNGKSAGKKTLDCEDEPCATFVIDSGISRFDVITARASCNSHGTWESERKAPA